MIRAIWQEPGSGSAGARVVPAVTGGSVRSTGERVDGTYTIPVEPDRCRHCLRSGHTSGLDGEAEPARSVGNQDGSVPTVAAS